MAYHIAAYLTLAFTLFTLIPRTRFTHWLIRVLDFPRLQISVGLTLCLAVMLAGLLSGSALSWWEWPGVIFIPGCLALMLQARWILPYTPFYPVKVPRAQTSERSKQLTILSANVLMTNDRYQALIDRVQQYQPDILVTLESDDRWEEALAVLHDNYPYRVACPLKNLYGMHVYSRLPLHDSEIKFLVEDDKPSIHAAIQIAGDWVNLHFMHPAPPSPTENPSSGERDAELLVLARKLETNGAIPAIVTGDLNDVAWSKSTQTFLQISRLKDPRIGRGTFNTFHTHYWFARWPLDHLFHSEAFKLVKMKRLKSIGSDHFPLLATLAYEPDNRLPKEPPPSKDDRDYAQERIDEQSVSAADVPNPARQ